MKFRTTIAPGNFDLNISHKDRIVAIGSCFSENISNLLQLHKFTLCQNPFGIIYNPVSVCNSINYLTENKKWLPEDIIQSGETYCSYDFHGSFSGLSVDEVLDNIHSSTQQASSFIKSATVLIITLGSAFAFKIKSSGKIAANCHKLPQANFERILLDGSHISSSLINCIAGIKKTNKDISVILTVSPVRHLRDGLVLNNLSKAILLQAVHSITSSQDRICYFPSFELLLDDLRDYRYYNADLVHPNSQGIEYIWDNFKKSFFDENTNEINDRIKKILNGVNHRPFLIHSEAYRDFISNLMKDIKELCAGHPGLDFNIELQSLQEKLSA